MLVFPTFAEKIEVTSRMLLAYFLIVVFLILDLFSLSSVNNHLTQIPFLLIALFYWAVYRPTLLPLWMVFGMGLLIDITSTVPFGLHAALFTGIFWFLATQRLSLIAQSYGVIWLLFGTVLIGFYAVRWFVMSVLNWTIFSLEHSGYEIMAGVFIFPFITLLLHLSHKLLPPVKGQMMMKL